MNHCSPQWKSLNVEELCLYDVSGGAFELLWKIDLLDGSRFFSLNKEGNRQHSFVALFFFLHQVQGVEKISSGIGKAISQSEIWILISIQIIKYIYLVTERLTVFRVLVQTKLPVIDWATNTINERFKSFCLNSSDSTFHVIMTQFFLSVHREKKLSHFDLKNWVTGGTKIWPNFLGQNDSIYSLSSQREKIESFRP